MRGAALSAVWVGARSLTLSPRVTGRLVVAGLLGVIGMATLTALGAYRMSFAAPEWWRTVNATDPATVALAERTEQAMTSAVHLRRPLGESWTVAVSAREANAWMNVMLPRWLENRDVERPGWADEVQLHFDSGWVGAGVMVADGLGRERFVTLRATPIIDESGALWLRPVGASVGRLSVPLRWTFEELERRVGVEQDERRLAEAVMGRRPVVESAELGLGDGRRVRVRGVRMEGGRLLVTCETVR